MEKNFNISCFDSPKIERAKTNATLRTWPVVRSVSLLLHMNGTNASTTFTDSSLNNYNLTATGNTTISTAQSKYGGASGYFDRNDASNLYMAGDVNFEFDADFTIECWVYLLENDIGYQAFVSSNVDGADATGFILLNESSNYLTFYASSSNFWNATLYTDYTIPTYEWTHLAVARENGTIRLFAGGIQKGSTFSDITVRAGNAIEIGHFTPLPEGEKTAHCYIDDVRIYKNYAAYTSNFTPPTSQLPNP